MTEAAFASLALLILGWAVGSALLLRVNVTGPLVFSVAGFLLGNPDWGLLSVDVATPSIRLLAEITLALLLFSDAARVNVSKLKRAITVPARLLGIGLPCSVVLGSVLAAWLFDDFTWALAGFVGAALAPTDAALSTQVINDRRIPMQVRRALNVESGLNDGLVTPIVAFTLVMAASELGIDGHVDSHEAGAVLELAVGVGVGLVIGFVSAYLIALGSRRRWIMTGGRRLATLAAALSSFAVAATFGGNGLIAAFVAGITFGAGLGGDAAEVEEAGELPELLGEILALAVWFLFGAALVPVALHNFDGLVLVYALLSLSVVRIIPVTLSILRTGMDKWTALFVGWFGPRGLASVVFALLAIEELGDTQVVERAVAVVSLTVLLSVVLHGASAGPLGRLYVQLEQSREGQIDAPRSRRPGPSYEGLR